MLLAFSHSSYSYVCPKHRLYKILPIYFHSLCSLSHSSEMICLQNHSIFTLLKEQSYLSLLLFQIKKNMLIYLSLLLLIIGWQKEWNPQKIPNCFALQTLTIVEFACQHNLLWNIHNYITDPLFFLNREKGFLKILYSSAKKMVLEL